MNIYPRTKHCLSLIAIILAFLLVEGGIARELDQVVEKSFTVEEGGLLTVKSDLGSIEVESAPGNSVKVRVEGIPEAASHQQDEAFFKVNFSQNGRDVKVEGKLARNSERLWRGMDNLRVRFLISVPAVYNVDLNTAGGSIRVDDLQGEVKAETSGGSLSFGNINGPLLGRTSGGSITLEGCTGKVDVNTSGGSIKIGKVDGEVAAHTSGGSIKIEQAGGNIRAATSGGSISVEEVMGDIDAATSGGSVSASITRQPQGRCRLETSGGNVTVYLAKDIAVDLDARSSWGRIESDFPVTGANPEEENILRGKINGGGPELYLRTSSGKIHVRER